eukprot:231593_1
MAVALIRRRRGSVTKDRMAIVEVAGVENNTLMATISISSVVMVGETVVAGSVEVEAVADEGTTEEDLDLIVAVDMEEAGGVVDEEVITAAAAEEEGTMDEEVVEEDGIHIHTQDVDGMEGEEEAEVDIS